MPHFERNMPGTPETPAAATVERPAHPDTRETAAAETDPAAVEEHLKNGMKLVNSAVRDPGALAQKKGVALQPHVTDLYTVFVNGVKERVRVAGDKVRTLFDNGQRPTSIAETAQISAGSESTPTEGNLTTVEVPAEVRSSDEVLRDRRFAESHRNNVQETIAAKERRIAELDEIIGSKKTSLLRRIVEFRSINELEDRRKENARVLEGYRTVLAEESANIANLTAAYDRILADESERARVIAEETAAREAAEQEKILVEQSEREARDVKKISSENGCFFVHTLAYDGEFKPSVNNEAVDTGKMTVMDQLRANIALRPNISCSTIRENTTDGLFNGNCFGILVRGGLVRAASEKDMQTVAVGVGERTFAEGTDTLESIEKSIKYGRPVSDSEYQKKSGRVSHRHGEEYNELVVESPEIAGACYVADTITDTPDSSDFSVEGVRSWVKKSFGGNEEDELAYGRHRENIMIDRAEKFWRNAEELNGEGQQLFIVNARNQVYRIHSFDFKKRTFEVTTQFSPTHLDNASIGADEEVRKKMFDELLVADARKGFLSDAVRKKVRSGAGPEDRDLSNGATIESGQQKSSEQILKSLEADDFIRQQFESDAGVDEGYTIREHTLMVMTQFEKYFSGEQFPSDLSENSFKLILALHDIGKPMAIAAGDKRQQHEYSRMYVPKILKEQGLSDAEIKIGTALVAGDPIGHFLRSYDAKKCEEEVRGAAKIADMSPVEFMKILTIFYKVDAGSYTEDATIEGVVQGKKSLDGLFVFDHKNQRMSLLPEIEEKLGGIQKTLENNIVS